MAAKEINCPYLSALPSSPKQARSTLSTSSSSQKSRFSSGERRRKLKAARDSPTNLPPGRSKSVPKTPQPKTPQRQTIPRTAAKTPTSDGPHLEQVQSPPNLPPGVDLQNVPSPRAAVRQYQKTCECVKLLRLPCVLKFQSR